MTISYSALNYGINGSLLPIRCFGTLWPLTLCVSHLERTKTRVHQITHASQKTIKVTPGVPVLLLYWVLHILFLSEETLFFGLVLFYYLFNDGVMKDQWIMFSRENPHHLTCMDGRCGGLTRSQSGKQTGKVIEIHCFCMRVICNQIRSCMPILTQAGIFQNSN